MDYLIKERVNGFRIDTINNINYIDSIKDKLSFGVLSRNDQEWGSSCLIALGEQIQSDITNISESTDDYRVCFKENPEDATESYEIRKQSKTLSGADEDRLNCINDDYILINNSTIEDSNIKFKQKLNEYLDAGEIILNVYHLDDATSFNSYKVKKTSNQEEQYYNHKDQVVSLISQSLIPQPNLTGFLNLINQNMYLIKNSSHLDGAQKLISEGISLGIEFIKNNPTFNPMTERFELVDANGHIIINNLSILEFPKTDGENIITLQYPIQSGEFRSIGISQEINLDSFMIFDDDRFDNNLNIDETIKPALLEFDYMSDGKIDKSLFLSDLEIALIDNADDTNLIEDITIGADIPIDQYGYFAYAKLKSVDDTRYDMIPGYFTATIMDPNEPTNTIDYWVTSDTERAKKYGFNKMLLSFQLTMLKVAYIADVVDGIPGRLYYASEGLHYCVAADNMVKIDDTFRQLAIFHNVSSEDKRLIYLTNTINKIEGTLTFNLVI